MPHCNWFWGSHGCDLPPFHDGDHLCGTDEEPCCKHNGTHALSHLWSATGPTGAWADAWVAMSGFCFLGDQLCGDPDNCTDRSKPWHNDPMNVSSERETS